MHGEEDGCANDSGLGRADIGIVEQLCVAWKIIHPINANRLASPAPAFPSLAALAQSSTLPALALILAELEAKLRYTFANRSLLQAAITFGLYERLEFLGDAVLGVAVKHWFWRQTKLRARRLDDFGPLVCAHRSVGLSRCFGSRCRQNLARQTGGNCQVRMFIFLCLCDKLMMIS